MAVSVTIISSMKPPRPTPNIRIQSTSFFDDSDFSGATGMTTAVVTSSVVSYSDADGDVMRVDTLMPSLGTTEETLCGSNTGVVDAADSVRDVAPGVTDDDDDVDDDMEESVLVGNGTGEFVAAGAVVPVVVVVLPMPPAPCRVINRLDGSSNKRNVSNFSVFRPSSGPKSGSLRSRSITNSPVEINRV